MAARPKFRLNPVLLLLTLVILTLIVTFVFGLSVRREGRVHPTDQVFIDRTGR